MKQNGYTNWRNNTIDARLETDKKYLVLKMGDYLISTAGLGWYILYTFMGIRFAVENKFIPVVDWKNCKLPQYDAEKVGRENVWEYFFEQPFNVSVEEVYAKEDFFVIDDVEKFRYTRSICAEEFLDFCNKDATEWRQYFQKYIRFKNEIRECFDSWFFDQVHDIKNMIGILARGTDYKDLKPVGHLKPICEKEIFLWVDRLLDKKTDSEIFLATEDKEILLDFEKRYPKKVYYVDAKRYKSLGHDTLNMIYKEEKGYERDMKYLYALYVVSKCPKSIYSACGGGLLASLMRKEEGTDYHFLCHGYNRATGLIVGSSLEKEQGRMLWMGNKPMMFYALNTLRLLHVEDAYIIVTKAIEVEYQKLIGKGEEFGIRIHYLVSDLYDVVCAMACIPDFIMASKMILLYTDSFMHGIGIAKELSEKICKFDGAYVWGVKTFFSNNAESIQVNKELGIPEIAFMDYTEGNYSLIGKYVFDFELKEIVKLLIRKKSAPRLTDILNEYIQKRKLFFVECKRGTIYSRIENMELLEKTGQMISLMEELQKEKIGDFESFRERG